MMHHSFLITLALFCGAIFANGAVLISTNSQWRYFKGESEASNPIERWRSVDFDDETWAAGMPPFHYGDGLSGGTMISDMRNRYSSLFLRKKFNVSNPANVGEMTLNAICDDGLIAWINGVEIARFNMPPGNVAFNGFASEAASEPLQYRSYSVPNSGAFLVSGNNVLCVQVFNSSLSSSDLQLNLELFASAPDLQRPSITRIEPPPGAVGELSSITIEFNEPVQGITASDLLVNDRPAESISGSGNRYVFKVNVTGEGAAKISWDEGTKVTDFAGLPNTFDSQAESAKWEYNVRDGTSPELVSTTPMAGTVVRSLSQIEVAFSERVIGVDAHDLLVNGKPAVSVSGDEARYIFRLPTPEIGTVRISWAGDHGIRDSALSPNSFAATSWEYTHNPNYVPPPVRVNEILAAATDATQLKDEDGELQDWIELYNPTSETVNLAGWALSDDEEDPGRWTFPAITLAPGQYLVVFASGKDRKMVQAGRNFHSNFKLSPGGEFLALFNNESPRQPVFEFASGYPGQRNNHSYGFDNSNALKYFSAPTPGRENGLSVISGVVPPPHFSVSRGLFDAPFKLILSSREPGAVIHYTLDGSEPDASRGSLYSAPLVITNTATVRAVAIKANMLPSLVETHTFIFPASVLKQPSNPARFPSGPTAWSGFPADYEMDPEIVSHPEYRDQMTNALLALPSLSIVLNTDDMFGAARGIYTHPLERGANWERPCSVELIHTDGTAGFQINAGIQIQGNAAREPQKQPKHPMRLVFKGDYGPSKLDYQVFPDSPITEFDTLILRADFNTSWLHWNPTQRVRAQRTRDAWMKDSMRAMGGLAPHNRYVHLYINGLYWGIYDPSERPDGAFGASYMGGEKEGYDVINEGEVVDGNRVVYDKMLNLSNLGELSKFEEMKQYLDMPQFIDYMLLHFYVGHQDWGNIKNWYTLRRRDVPTGFKYVPWDGELILDSPTFNRVSSPDVPSGLHTKLMASAEYRLAFADHAHKHLLNKGALSPDAVAERWRKRASEIEIAIIAESARWGDYRRDAHQYQTGPYELYTRNNQWMAEQRRLLTQYFPQRTEILLNQLKSANLYPSVAAPSFNQHGGQVAGDFRLQITAPAGTIYYTTDGTDPRNYGSGQVSQRARSYSQPIALTNSAIVKARAFSGGIWSALNEAEFKVNEVGMPLHLAEIMYHPEGGDAFEFLEFQNGGSSPLELGGFYLKGVSYIFPPDLVLQPGERFVLASKLSPPAFAERYPGVTVGGYFEGSLSNSGEAIEVLDSSGRTVLLVDYSDVNGWPELADGKGASLELINVLADPQSLSNWQASPDRGGSPGMENAAPNLGLIQINEFQAAGTRADPEAADWVELLNVTTNDVELSGWRLVDDSSNFFEFPQGSIIQPGELIQVWCDGFTNVAGFHAPFGLNRTKESLLLNDKLGNRVDAVTFGPQPRGFSFGRIGRGGEWQPMIPSPKAVNEKTELGSVSSLSINEWMVNPIPGETDWIELYNRDTERPVRLTGIALSSPNGLHMIKAPSAISPGEWAVFEASGESGADQLFFKLPAAGGRIVLQAETGELLDQVTYENELEDGFTSGRLPDGSSSITRFSHGGSPNTANRAASHSSPVLNELLIGDGDSQQPSWIELHNPSSNPLDLSGMGLGKDLSRQVQWAFPPNCFIPANGFLVVWCDTRRPASVQMEANLNFGQPLDSAGGAVFLFSANGQVLDSLAYGLQIPGQSIASGPQGWYLAESPTPAAPNSRAALLGSSDRIVLNEWMALPASGDDWFETYNPESLPVELSGMYFSDDPSIAGKMQHQIPPISFLGPKSWAQWIATGRPSYHPSHVSFSLDFEGESIRIYSASSALIDSVDFSVQKLGISEGRIDDGSSAIGSLPGATPGKSNSAIMVADQDDDGLSDSWELENGLDPRDHSDALSDIDGDGQDNLAEFLAGTNPRNIASRLKIENVSMDGRTMILNFTAAPGRSYVLQYKADLNSSEWLPLKIIQGGASPEPVQVQDLLTNVVSGRFYRILLSTQNQEP